MAGINTQRILNILKETDDKKNGTFEDDGSHYRIKMVKEILKTLKGKEFSFTYDRNGNLTLKHDTGEFTFYPIVPDTEETRKNKEEQAKIKKAFIASQKLVKAQERKDKDKLKLVELEIKLDLKVSKLNELLLKSKHTLAEQCKIDRLNIETNNLHTKILKLKEKNK